MQEIMTAGCPSDDGAVLRQIPVPKPGNEDILVRVLAAGLNRADLLVAEGTYHQDKETAAKPIGMEWAGEVAAWGDAVTDFKIGDSVLCYGNGGYAEYATAHQRHCVRFDPAQLPVEEAAVLPLALLTASNALSDVAKLRPGETVLVQGATSAVGLAALQIAKILGASAILGTSRSADKREKLFGFGADASLDSSREGWWKEVLAFTNGKGADVVVDFVTGSQLNDTMKATALLGRIVNIGRLGGRTVEFDLNLHALRRLAFFGVTFRTRTNDDVSDIMTGVRRDLWPSVEQGKLRLPIAATYPLTSVVDALAQLSKSDHLGKLVLQMPR